VEYSSTAKLTDDDLAPFSTFLDTFAYPGSGSPSSTGAPTGTGSGQAG
jgi:hypothetical protein